MANDPPRWLSNAQAFFTLVSTCATVLIAVASFKLKDQVETGIRQGELQLKHSEFHVSTAKEMRDLMTSALDPRATDAQATSAAMSLAGFREPSLAFFVELANAPGVNQHIGARAGFRAVGLIEHGKTCVHLRRITDNRSRLFRWETHALAAELSADLECPGALPAAEALLTAVTQWQTDPKSFSHQIDNTPALSVATHRELVDRLKDVVSRTIRHQ